MKVVSPNKITVSLDFLYNYNKKADKNSKNKSVLVRYAAARKDTTVFGNKSAKEQRAAEEKKRIQKRREQNAKNARWWDKKLAARNKTRYQQYEQEMKRKDERKAYLEAEEAQKQIEKAFENYWYQSSRSEAAMDKHAEARADRLRRQMAVIAQQKLETGWVVLDARAESAAKVLATEIKTDIECGVANTVLAEKKAKLNRLQNVMNRRP